MRGAGALLVAAAAIAGVAAPPRTVSAADEEERALAYLAREVPEWRAEHACGSCHNNGDAARALLRARRLGRPVPDQALASTLEWLRDPDAWERIGGSPERGDAKLARLQFGAALVEAREAGLVEGAGPLPGVAAALARDQDADGAWRIAEQRSMGSPVAWGPFVATWQARHTLRAADAERFADAIAAGEAWLLAQTPRNVMDAAATLLALGDSDAAEAGAQRERARAYLLEAQTSDGGWGPWPRSAPEVFDTALAVLALAAAPEGGDAVRRGRAFLASAQLGPGGWPETTRPAGYQSYAQHVSTSGWATLALLETAAPISPEPPRTRPW